VPAKILPLLIDVADLLDLLHANHIVHRDLKPDNVMVRRGPKRDEAVLIDFGIALLDGQPDTLKSYGTAGYMAPEQARGDAKLDARADIYSLGKMILEVWPGGDAPKPLGSVAAQMLDEEPANRPPLDAVRAAIGACCEALKS
jgi:serine/threonine protein kinase